MDTITTAPTFDPFATLRSLTREQIEQRIGEIEAERAQLIALRRSIAARERVRRRRTSRIEETPNAS